uniref:NADH-ubiquinone oxidoreductase chain 4 n=2 Tax=Meretrix TaxID=74490 RepID=C8CP68_MERMT|nr:NADH dehydrogenase subunit 4 [Meretrix petechialis]YP_003162830.1 NADH dehydrogenase subunit 4 [Meretrix meretrix]ABV53327.1 NADH dehydrogenase subunit 4 [Meretrix petechialis]ACU68436.1 NADH dehydrogenase subunit 4 [Meretrix meretrix]
MGWVFPIIVMYFITLFEFSWGSWCVITAMCSLIMLLMDSGYNYYYLSSEWFGMDQLSQLLVVLCFLVLATSLGASCKELKFNNGLFDRNSVEMVQLIVLITLGSVVFFSVSSWMDFYFFFEFSLVPTFWLILKWGYQPERLQAGLYMLMYTVSASLPLLCCLVMFWFMVGSDNMLLSKSLGVEFISSNSSVVWLFVFLPFLVKLPIFFFHGWLPKAHVEAPLSGSMLLAGVLLKFGAYGVLRFLWMTQVSMMEVILFVMMFSVWGGLISSCVCLTQNDLKSMIAYSSIGHMSICLGGILSMYPLGKMGAVSLLFAHGLCSPALFSMAAMVYEVVGTRNVVLSKGVLRLFPIFSVCWFLSCIVNMSIPPSLNFFSEVYCVVSMVWVNWVFAVPCGLMVFLTGCYSLSLYNWVNHGMVSEYINPIWGVSPRYIYSVLFLILFLLISSVGLDFFFV